jgi:endoglucanase
MHHRFILKTLTKVGVATALLSFAFLAAQANAQTLTDKTLPPDTRFFVPQPASGSVEQAVGLFEKFQLKNALLIAAMEATPQAVWLTGNTPAQTASTVTQTLREATFQRAIPVFVLYNIPEV